MGAGWDSARWEGGRSCLCRILARCRVAMFCRCSVSRSSPVERGRDGNPPHLRASVRVRARLLSSQLISQFGEGFSVCALGYLLYRFHSSCRSFVCFASALGVRSVGSRFGPTTPPVLCSGVGSVSCFPSYPFPRDPTLFITTIEKVTRTHHTFLSFLVSSCSLHSHNKFVSFFHFRVQVEASLHFHRLLSVPVLCFA